MIPRRRAPRFLAYGVLCAVAFAPAQSRAQSVTATAPPVAGHAAAAVDLRLLPPVTHASPALRTALVGAARALVGRAPAPPAAATHDAQTRWTNQLGPWLRAYMQRMTAAQEPLSRITVAVSPERPMAVAAMAVMFEHTAWIVYDIATPPSLARDPELVDVYRAQIENQFEVFARRAREGYDVCARAAAVMAAPAWNAFCAGRAAWLGAMLTTLQQTASERRAAAQAYAAAHPRPPTSTVGDSAGGAPGTVGIFGVLGAN